jgi:hypothetical protein
MGLGSFELATVFLDGHNSLSPARTWKCRGYVRLCGIPGVVAIKLPLKTTNVRMELMLKDINAVSISSGERARTPP